MITAALLLLIAVVKDQSENVQAHLEKPILSANRGDGVYVTGEEITFTCKTTNCLDSKRTFLLYKEGIDESIEQYSTKFTIRVTSTGSEYYSCAYTCRNEESDKSLTVRIYVVARPEKPRIKSERLDKVYLSDESFELTCWITGSACSDGIFDLYQNRHPVQQELTQRKSAKFTIANGRSASRTYSCLYTCTASGRRIFSEESDKIEITVVARPARPRIKSDRTDKVYLSDEPVKLTCSTTAPACSAGIFRLYYNRQETLQASVQRKSATFTIANGGDASGKYSCFYGCTVSGRDISSEESEKIYITVVAQPARPRIKSDRADNVYRSDESVRLTCWITSRAHSVGTFQLCRNGQKLQDVPTQRNTATFTIENGGDASGIYSCLYTCTVSSRRISSNESDTIQITVVDLPRPSISLASSHVSQGEDVTFNCTATKSTSVGTFYLYKNGVPLNDLVSQSADAENKLTTFTIQNVGPGDSGNYTCVYEVLERARYLTSVSGDSVLLSVSGKSIQPWIPALPVVILMLILGVLGVYCWKKGKSRGPRELRAAPPPNDGRSDDVVYADLTVVPQTTKQKGKKKRVETHGGEGTVYADVKL